MSSYKLVCTGSDNSRVSFTVVDEQGAFCGALTILRNDVHHFIAQAWKGTVEWRGFDPASEVFRELTETGAY